jgi:1,4-dihydroxy-2-naphthoate octaprenyltransferase
MKKGYIYSIKRVLEIVVVIFLLSRIALAGVFLSNKEDSFISTIGLLIIIASVMGVIFYTLWFAGRINKYLEENL